MSLNSNNLPSNRGMEIVPMEVGTYPARTVAVVDLGLQPQAPWAGKDRPPAHKVAFTYEFVDEFLKDEDGNDIKDKPRWLTEMMPIYNLSSEKAKSTIRYKTFDPENKHKGDFSKIINTPVMVTIVHNPNNKKPGSVWENVGEVTAMRAKDVEKCPPLVNPVMVFDMDEPDVAVFTMLPQFIQKIIVGGLEFSGSKLEAALTAVNYNPVAEAKEETKDGEAENPY